MLRLFHNAVLLFLLFMLPPYWYLTVLFVFSLLVRYLPLEVVVYLFVLELISLSSFPVYFLVGFGLLFIALLVRRRLLLQS